MILSNFRLFSHRQVVQDDSFMQIIGYSCLLVHHDVMSLCYWLVYADKGMF